MNALDRCKARRQLTSIVDLSQQRVFPCVLFGSTLIVSLLIGHNAFAFNGKLCGHVLSCEHYIVEQQPSTNPLQPGSNTAPSSPKEDPNNKSPVDEDKKKILSKGISEQSEKVAKLRQANHVWNIFFVATGVSLTLLATTLGAVGSASEKAKAKTTITIAIIGAVAAAAQTIASKIPVAKRAGEYAKIQAALVGLGYKVNAADTQSDLKSAQSEFEKQILKIGETEASD
jgi:hypothetical protein